MTDDIPWVRYGDERPRLHDIVEIEGEPEPGHRIMVGSDGWHGRLKSLGDELRYRVVGKFAPSGTSYGEDAEQCENCRFWARRDNEQRFPGTDGVCRRYAPQGTSIKEHSEAGWQLFPPMNSNEWCGDYSRKRATPMMDVSRSNIAA